jgi:hypothetical protein
VERRWNGDLFVHQLRDLDFLSSSGSHFGECELEPSICVLSIGE